MINTINKLFSLQGKVQTVPSYNNLDIYFLISDANSNMRRLVVARKRMSEQQAL